MQFFQIQSLLSLSPFYLYNRFSLLCLNCLLLNFSLCVFKFLFNVSFLRSFTPIFTFIPSIRVHTYLERFCRNVAWCFLIPGRERRQSQNKLSTWKNCTINRSNLGDLTVDWASRNAICFMNYTMKYKMLLA